MSRSPFPIVCIGVLGSQESDCDTLKLTSVRPDLPFFVVMRMTPLPALEP